MRGAAAMPAHGYSVSYGRPGSFASPRSCGRALLALVSPFGRWRPLAESVPGDGPAAPGWLESSRASPGEPARRPAGVVEALR